MKPNIRLPDEISPLEKLSLQPLSYSRLNAFDWCEAQYFYNYIMKYPQEFSPKALLGNVIHKALELSIRDGEKINKTELYDNYRAAREEYDPNNEVILDELFEEGFPMLEDFLARHGESKAKITEAELQFEFVFHGALFRGFIDYVLVTEKEVILRDYKSGSFEVANKNVPSDLQLGIYALYMKYLYPDKTISAGLHYLRSNRIKKHTYSDEDFKNVEERLIKAIDGLRNRRNFLPVPKHLAWKCRMCSYRKDGVCKAGEFNVDQADRKKNKLIGDTSLY